MHKLRFSAVIGSQEVLANFYDYLKRSYSLEPLEFLLSVDEFRRETDLIKKSTTAKIIVESHVKSGAKKEINIDGLSRNAIIAKYEFMDEQNIVLDLFDNAYTEVKNDSFVRYLDSELFTAFVRKKGDQFFSSLLATAVPTHPITMSDFNTRNNITDIDISNMIRLAEGVGDWTPLQITRKDDREKDYYSYISKNKYKLHDGIPECVACKLVGVLPVSAEEAVNALLDPKYKHRWDAFTTYETEVGIFDGNYDVYLKYYELKLLFFLSLRCIAGGQSLMYDTARRAYIRIGKTNPHVDIDHLKQNKDAIKVTVVQLDIIYKISDTKCRYITCTYGYLHFKDPTEWVMKRIFKKKGKKLFANWSQISKEIQKNGETERPNNRLFETLDSFEKKYIPTPDCVKTW